MANLQAFERGDYQQVKADLHRKSWIASTSKNSDDPTATRPAKKFLS